MKVISNYFLHECAPLSNTPVGCQLANVQVAHAVEKFEVLKCKGTLKHYIKQWNDRSGKPLSEQDICDLCDCKLGHRQEGGAR